LNLSSLSIKRPIFLTSVVLVTLLVGGLCLRSLGVDQFPDVTFPVVVISIPYSGASPEEIETLVSKPIEEELSSTSGMKRLSSKNQESLALIVAEFTLGTDIKFAEQEIRDKVSKVRGKLPKEIDEPIIQRVDVADQPIMSYSLSGDLSPAQLYDVAENDVKPRLEQTKDVGLVTIIGGTKREIKVELDRVALKKHELSINAVAAKIAASAQNVPVGKVDDPRHETIFRTIGEYKNINQIKDTVVNFFGSDVPVSVGSLGDVKDSVEDEKNRGFLNGKPALFLEARKQSGTNTVAVADGLTKKVIVINSYLQNKPGHLKVALVRDGARFIRANVQDVKDSILEGIVLAVLVVFLFLGNIRSTLITGLALPNSLLGAFILMYLMGFTINVMTLLALSLAVGLLIDDAIVVRENIFRRLEEGENSKEAAEKGTNEVTLAVVATTLTVIAVFLPVGFLSGTVGQFFKQFGLTIVFAMIISLFDALTMAPMLSAYFAGASEKNPKGLGKILHHMSQSIENFQDHLANIYERVLKFTLRKPAIILASAILIFVFSIGLAKSVKSTFIPNADNGEFQVSLEMPPGTSLDATENIAKKVEGEIKSFTEVDRVSMTVGDSDGQSNVASFYVGLVNYKMRKRITTEIKALLREKLTKYSQALPKVGDINAVGGADRPFNLNLQGENLDEMSKYADRIVAKFRKIQGLVDVDTNYRLGKPEYQVQMDPKKIQRYGVLSVQAGQELRTQMEGNIAAKFRENGNEYDIRVRLKPDQRNLQKYFNETYVPNINGNLVRLKDVAQGVLTQGPSKISRQNRARLIQISGDLGTGGALGNIRQEAEKIIKDENLPAGITYSFQGQAEDFQDLIINMIIAVGLAVVLVFLILSSLYESFVTPFTIMLALPLAVAGAIIALFLFHQTLNLFSMIGMIMLLGLVTKNSILLVDYTLQLLKQGKSRNEALMEAGLKRLRPILMTTVALIAGMLPVALGLSEAARSRTSMGIAIIGGLISSTLLTLVVVPAAFGFIDDFRQWCARRLGNVFLSKDLREITSNLDETLVADGKFSPDKNLTVQKSME
jgi:HAE1 family hydrophobic/amphiphilic exporter-1